MGSESPAAVHVAQWGVDELSSLRLEAFRTALSDSGSQFCHPEESRGTERTHQFCVVDGEWAGYIAGSVIGEEGEVLHVEVLPAFRRQGVALRLMEDFAKRFSLSTVFLEVRASNSGARALYNRLGFRETGVRPDYYRAPLEDAIVMAWSRGSAGEKSDRR